MRISAFVWIAAAACHTDGQPASPRWLDPAFGVDWVNDSGAGLRDAAGSSDPEGQRDGAELPDDPSSDAQLGPSDASIDTDAGFADANIVQDAGQATDPFLQPVRCWSGVLRSPHESEGPEMLPGQLCNGCHNDDNSATGGDAPIFAFAGTLYSSGHEPDNCDSPAAEGATVVITDANGAVHTTQANGAGNFFLDDFILAVPYRAKVMFQGRTREMVLPQTNVDCNTCHTEAGTNDAPGRIVLP